MPTKTLIIFLLIMLALVPLGLISEYPAWGEWGIEEFQTMVGYIPHGMQNAGIDAPIPDYEINSLSPIWSTLISAAIGIVLSFLFFTGIKKVKSKN
jgi:cobalt/nickel transport protein